MDPDFSFIIYHLSFSLSLSSTFIVYCLSFIIYHLSFIIYHLTFSLSLSSSLSLLPEAFVNPESCHRWLSIVEILVSTEQSLEHPRDVPEVEQVVNLIRGGKEASHNSLVHLQGSLGHHVSYWLHLFFKLLEKQLKEEDED